MAGKAIFEPKYIPAEVMRKMTREQLKIIQTQKNTKGKYSQNANNAQKILWSFGRTNYCPNCGADMRGKKHE